MHLSNEQLAYAFTKESRRYFRLGRGEPLPKSGMGSEDSSVSILPAIESWEVM